MHPVHELKIVLWQQIYWDICHVTFVALHTRAKFAGFATNHGCSHIGPVLPFKAGRT